MHKTGILGIDAGSVSVSLALVGPQKEIIKTAYEFHHGDVTGRLRSMLADFDLAGIGWIAVTGSTPGAVLRNSQYTTTGLR